MNRMRLLVAGVALLLLVGCSRGTDVPLLLSPPASPDEAVRLVHSLCLDGEYEMLVSLFVDGSTLWETNPASFRNRVDRVCQNTGGDRAPYLKIQHSEIKGEGAMFQTFSFAKEDYSDGGRYSEWQLIKVHGGWRVASLLST